MSVQITKAYCSACDHDVRIAVLPGPVHGGQAETGDTPEVVCLDFGTSCTGAMCPMFGLPSLLMGVRLAQSGLREEPWKTVRAPCQGCGNVVDHQVIDATHLLCPECNSRSRYVRVQADDEDYVALAQV
ncbi:MAG TPA: hypothetical protein VFZ36_03980 [Vicinamibacterales bacterium]